MDKDILSNIFKKLDVVDVIMGASRVCITWFLASHNKTIWNTIKLNDLDSIILDNPFSPNLQASDSRYQLRKILAEINKFARTIPNSFFFNVYCSVAEEDLAIISNGMPNIQKLALPTWTSLDINSIQSAFSKWQNLQTLIIHPFISMTVREVSSVELQDLGENCRNLTTMKFTAMLSKDLANIIVCNFPSLERLSFRCNYACIDASISLIIGLPNLRIFNLSHCIFTQNTGTGKSCILGMRPKDELVQAGTKKLVCLWCVVRTVQFARMYGNTRIIQTVTGSSFVMLRKNGGKQMR
ncbi:PREDICTED: putative F-box protein At4g11580 [Brassica oleracea var. oleracea]|uniref:putative F-box protein At4g11580 n=1 Tax=Brassica oleracea var. oleracea TaxID=109376 RepID=UPI0006A75275|nr:PREDICTED: putative F-box protein At4g11580 [Brassica oleracea var. oleracea]